MAAGAASIRGGLFLADLSLLRAAQRVMGLVDDASDTDGGSAAGAIAPLATPVGEPVRARDAAPNRELPGAGPWTTAAGALSSVSTPPVGANARARYYDNE
eukprot:8345184-Alexandrium_andersonii.AAC.1